ncbi:MAG: hypothetical protein RLZZ453_468 [Chlamydiota bacterium]|jgi:hypothetical protein
MSYNVIKAEGDFYFNNTPSNKNSSVYDRLGACQYTLQQRRASPMDLDLLGIGSNAQTTQEFFTSLLERNLTVESSDKAGIFWLLDNGNKVAVFKVGCRRATIELLAGRVTTEYLKVPHISSGMISVMCNLDLNPLENEDDICVPTWRGRLASYPKQRSTTAELRRVIGLTQPYLSPMTRPLSETSLASLVLALIAIGARDIKNDAILGNGISVDTEQCFPEHRVMPSFTVNSKVVSITDLPFLSEYTDRMDLPFSAETMQFLKETVSSWDVNAVVEFLRAQRITIFDQTRSHGYEVQQEIINPDTYPYPSYDYLEPKINPKRQVLLDSQIAEIKYRLAKLKRVIESKEIISLSELVFCVDSYGGQYYHFFNEASIDHKKREVALERPPSVIGRTSPEEAFNNYPGPEAFGILLNQSFRMQRSFSDQ